MFTRQLGRERTSKARYYSYEGMRHETGFFEKMQIFQNVWSVETQRKNGRNETKL